MRDAQAGTAGLLLGNLSWRPSPDSARPRAPRFFRFPKADHLAEYVLLGVALGGTATFARSRGLPWMPVVMAALGGWVPIAWISSWAARSPGDWAMALEFAWAWLAFVAAGSWFVSSKARRILPTWPWPCGACGYVNSRGVVECESCGKSWRKPPQ